MRNTLHNSPSSSSNNSEYIITIMKENTIIYVLLNIYINHLFVDDN